MSLNGLDATEVNLAYQTALAEAGGWLVILTVNLLDSNSQAAGAGSSSSIHPETK